MHNMCAECVRARERVHVYVCVVHRHIGHRQIGHLTSDMWTSDTGEEKRTLDTWTLETCISIFPHGYEHSTCSHHIKKLEVGVHRIPHALAHTFVQKTKNKSEI